MARHADTPHRTGWRTILTVILASQLVVALATAGLVWAAYNHLNGNIKTGGAIPAIVPSDKLKVGGGPTGPLNILVLGIDTRDCAGCKIDGEQGGDGSDTTILLHVSADRKTVYGISIPRDALVNPVPCTKNDIYEGTGLVEWNSAYTVGKAPCAVEQMAKAFGVTVPVDHYVTVNFGGFKDMVDAVGGVDVCIPEDLDDPQYEHWDFPKSSSYHLDGVTALKYVRLRHATNLDGSDTGRIKRQQYFVSRLIDKVKSAQTLTSFTRLYGFAKAFTGSLTVDKGLGGGALANLAWQLRGVDLGHIKFITLPTANYPQPPGNPYYGRVKVLPAAKTLLRKVKADKPLGSFAKGAQSAGKKHKKHLSQTAKAADEAAGLCS